MAVQRSIKYKVLAEINAINLVQTGIELQTPVLDNVNLTASSLPPKSKQFINLNPLSSWWLRWFVHIKIASERCYSSRIYSSTYALPVSSSVRMNSLGNRGKLTISKSMDEEARINRLLYNRVLFKSQQLTQLQKHSAQYIPVLTPPQKHQAVYKLWAEKMKGWPLFENQVVLQIKLNIEHANANIMDSISWDKAVHGKSTWIK